mmetsp:Transcript_6705/g.16116  ORF Transcript_6705/g.16116 Transcript_6705/m.16116 type:complete len:458 (+) Transcript_6705:135-1508(+)
MLNSASKSPTKGADVGKHFGQTSKTGDSSMSEPKEMDGGTTRPSRGGGRGGTIHENSTPADMVSRYQELQKLYEDKASEHEKLHSNIKKQKESYIRREVFYKSQISHIKDTLEKTVLCRGVEEVSMPKIRDMHRKILGTIGEFHARTTRSIEEHERDLSRQFRTKMIEIEEKLSKDQHQEEDLAGVPRAWVERTSKLAKEVDKHKEQAIRLDRINEVLNRNIEKYRSECKAQQDDREFLVRQMVAIKKENARLRLEVDKISEGIHPESSLMPVPAVRSGTPASDPGHPGTGKIGGVRRPMTAASAQLRAESMRYTEVTARLKKLLESERRQTRDARAAHAKLVANRTELEGMVEECLNEIKDELGVDPAAAFGQKGLSKEERERVLEMLLSQDKTIALIYGQTYKTTGLGSSALASQTQHPRPAPTQRPQGGVADKAEMYKQELLHVSGDSDDDAPR